MNFFTGFLIGVVSLIPGISGGTVLILMKQYENTSYAISHFKEKKYFFCILALVLGIFLGAITFARIIEFLFYFFPNETMLLFSCFVLFQIPYLVKQEKRKPKVIWFGLGLFAIFSISVLSSCTEPVIIDFPEISFLFLILFAFCGALDGFFTILPGVSGSMMMMILGPYYLYKSFLASLDFQHLYFLFPLGFYFLGDMLGFYVGSKFSLYFLKKCRNSFMSFILGMVLASAILLLPFSSLKLQSLIIIIASYFIVKFLQKFA